MSMRDENSMNKYKKSNRERVRVSINTLVVDGSNLLLGKRAGKNGDGSWCCPGGHLEFGESALEAAKRELKEETSIEATNISFLHVLNDPYCDNLKYHYVTLNFLVDGWLGIPKVMEPDKCYEWKWFPADALPKPLFSHHMFLIEMWKEGKMFQDVEKEYE